MSDGQTARRCAECTVQDVDLDDLVLEVRVVEVVVPLVAVQVAVAVPARMKTWRGHLRRRLVNEAQVKR